MKGKIWSVLVILILFTISCEDKSVNYYPNCELLYSGMLNRDQEILRVEFSKLTYDLSPRLFADDDPGHLKNFDTLIERINYCEGMVAELICYACIETYPPLSELLIKIDSSGTLVARIIDITTPLDKNLIFAGIHHSIK